MEFTLNERANVLQVKNSLKDKYTLFFVINCLVLLFLSSFLLLSIIFHPLPLTLFVTLGVASICYFLLLLFKLIENNLITIQNIRLKVSIKLSKRLYQSITIFCISLLLLLIYFIIIPLEGHLIDVDKAVITAVQSFTQGINPYVDAIIPHYYSSNDYADISTGATVKATYGTYNYLPVDLLLYSIGCVLFTPFFGSLWFYLTNFLVLVFCIFLFHRYYPLSVLKCIIIFFPAIILGVIVLNDIWQILFFIIFVIFIDKQKYDEEHNKSYYLVSVTLLSLGFLTKMLLIFILPVFLLYNTRSWRLRIFYTIYSIIFSLIPMIFFNFNAVINSVFVFHSNIDTRSQMASISGIIALPLQELNLSVLYVPIFVLAYLIVLYIARFYSPTLEGRILFVVAIVILMLPSSNFLATIWVVFICGIYIVYNNFVEGSKISGEASNTHQIVA